jgi:arylformamidase
VLDLLMNSSQSTCRLIDLSPPLGKETRAYPTDPVFNITWHATIETDGANVSKIETGPHIGSHVDAPKHFIAGGMDISSMPLEAFMGPAVVIDAPKRLGEDIVADDLSGADIRPGDIVLVHTGWGVRMNSDRFFEEGWPGFTSQAIQALIDLGVKAIGTDSPSADNSSGAEDGFPGHKTALLAGLPIFEGLANLDQIVGKRLYFIGLPLRIEDAEASPVRAIAIVER